MYACIYDYACMHVCIAVHIQDLTSMYSPRICFIEIASEILVSTGSDNGLLSIGPSKTNFNFTQNTKIRLRNVKMSLWRLFYSTRRVSSQ